ncbi:MAG: extracellular solute-binding protein [Zoogloeaceae bacterium]|jgi:sn-glycerol 3-phosphate transport system substrate-binding protein|nr:extracellular solute-binding protein [Zoogloeaceae bacterium]
MPRLLLLSLLLAFTAAQAANPAGKLAAAAAKPAAKVAAKAVAKSAPQPVVITLRHALTGEHAALLVELVDRFNADSKTGQVSLQHLDTVDNPRQLPHMALLADDEHQKFFGSYPRLLPLWKALSLTGERLDTKALFPVLADAVEDSRGRVQALPLALSVPVLYYNKDTFRKAGLDPARPPRTWLEVQESAGKIYQIDRRCPFTSSEVAWVHVDNTSTQHSEPLANPARGGKGATLALNGLVQVKHVALLASWHKSFYFRYFGPDREADEKFLAGECGMLTGDSSLYMRLLRNKPFDFGLADLPHHDDVRGVAPGRLLPDGALLWILADKKRPEYAVATRFIRFLLQPDVQREWVNATGFLPMTPAAVDALAAAGNLPPEIVEKTVARLSDRKYASGAKPKTVAGMGRVRGVLSEELEAVWDNRKPAKEALDTAVKKGNTLLRPASTDGVVTQ